LGKAYIIWATSSYVREPGGRRVGHVFDVEVGGDGVGMAGGFGELAKIWRGAGANRVDFCSRYEGLR